MADKIATREAYGNALAEFGEKYDFVVLDADLAAATKTGVFRKKFPDRHFECGIAEGNMMVVAAGIASTGVIPFVSTFAMFAAGRAFEQVRNGIGYPHLNVKIGATHAGISVGEDGATHQCNEDIATMRTIPGMTIINPADAVEARACVEAAILHNGPVYMRFGRLAIPTLYDASTYKFELGKGVMMSEGKDVTIIATGLMVHKALEAKELLKNEGIDAEVINIHTIKPLDRDMVIASAKKTGCVVTAEEHNIIGGLGSAVAEALSETCPVPVLRVGVEDQFGRSGKVPPLLELYGLTAENIAAKAKASIALKK
ncbi:MAG: transketolase family protein [Clostridia bacterium]|nr:transketolase family protein [Clostridia bacterium]